jgi:carboxylesterase
MRLALDLEAASRTRILKSALPIRIDPPGATEAVLLLHGFTGYPAELGLPARLLAEQGYAVRIPRYPGHGGSRADFMRTGRHDWLRSALDEWLDLRASYDTVHVVGHSMGGLIATAVASYCDVGKLVLLAPAFLVLTPGIAFSPLVAPFVPVMKKGRPIDPKEAGNPDRVLRHAEYGQDDIVAEAAELRRLMVECRRLLPRVKSPILVVMGEKDDTVSSEVGGYIRKRATSASSVQTAVVPNAGHTFPFDGGAEEGASLVVSFLGRPSTHGAL